MNQEASLARLALRMICLVLLARYVGTVARRCL